jgi:tRNA-modifying protein YgfZ
VEAKAPAIELDGQYRALREQAGFVDRSRRGMLTVRGDEAAEFLQGQVSNEVEALAPGEGRYAALLDRKGHMQADLRLLRVADDEIWIDTEPEATGVLARHLDMYRIGRQAEVEDASGERVLLSVIGPAAVELVGTGPLTPEHAHREAELAPGVPARVVATDLGVDLVAVADSSEAVRARLEAAGIVEVADEAAEILRVESGRPRFGREMTTATIPAEAGIDERAVSFDKGCYIGQETVARLHYKGKPNRHLRGLRLSAPANDGDPVRLGEREVGAVGTAVISPLHGPIALAILRREADPGATVIVATGIEAEVTEVPFRSA